LAFDFKEPAGNSKQMIGEIIISAQTVKRNSKIYGTAPLKELILCVIHGILHLLNYDDHSPRDIKKMRKEESRLLEMFKL